MPIFFMDPLTRKREGATLGDRQFVTRFMCLTVFLFLLLALAHIVWV